MSAGFTPFKNLPKEEQDWLDAYLNDCIEPEAFEALQRRLVESLELRTVMRRYLALDHHLQNDLSVVDVAVESWLGSEPEQAKAAVAKHERRTVGWAFVTLAAAVTVVVGLTAGFWNSAAEKDLTAGTTEKEPLAEGFAVVGRLFDVVWPEIRHREGDTLGAEVFRLESGTAEVQFYSGAMMTLQGPAEISLKSAWEAVCHEGLVRMHVPPAARGFKLRAPASEIEDLGTEFGLHVTGGHATVEVFDGEVVLRHQEESERLLKKGAVWALPELGSATPEEAGRIVFPDVTEFGSRADAQKQADFDRWLTHRDALALDQRLIAYYTFDRDAVTGLVPNKALPRNPDRDGTAILAEPVSGRWANLKNALEFHRPGSRVRVNIPGESPAFTFMCWVRIDSLDRWYNALFMGDGYETGEPHWQIRDDGQMMLSVMVDDTRPNPKSPNDAGFHRVYYSPPMWDRSMSGQWMHLTSVFDPGNRAVSHFVNGQRISRHTIEDQYLIKTLRIGNAEIGNWGQPFREEPTFAIRNLNGRMDELAVFKVALSEEEVAMLYERSRSSVR